jgi:hypothetical protein
MVKCVTWLELSGLLSRWHCPEKIGQCHLEISPSQSIHSEFLRGEEYLPTIAFTTHQNAAIDR